jgi:uncharacterized protein
MTTAIVSPCKKLCCVEPQSGYCLGCQRTLAEIAQWQRFSETQREQIMADLPSRREKLPLAYR